MVFPAAMNVRFCSSVMPPSSLTRASNGTGPVGRSEKTMVSESPTRSVSALPPLVEAAGALVTAGRAMVSAGGAVVNPWISANGCCDVSVWQPASKRTAKSPAQSVPHPPHWLRTMIIGPGEFSRSILLFDVQFCLVAGPGFGASGRVLVLVAGVVLVVIAAIVVVTLVLRHVDVVQDDANEIAADFLNQLLGADVHRLRIAAVLDDLQANVHSAGQNGGITDPHDRGRIEKDEIITLFQFTD